MTEAYLMIVIGITSFSFVINELIRIRILLETFLNKLYLKSIEEMLEEIKNSREWIREELKKEEEEEEKNKPTNTVS